MCPTRTVPAGVAGSTRCGPPRARPSPRLGVNPGRSVGGGPAPGGGRRSPVIREGDRTRPMATHEDRPIPAPTASGPWVLALAAAVAVGAYVYGLDSINAPTIGDEPLYLQIARVTAASGRWLPLVSEAGVNNTKPPLLFWQGIASTGRGAAWDLWHIRLPVVATSLVTALLVAWMAARIAGRGAGIRAGLVFLGFLSTMQHGRPFLTNAGETLFLFLPLVLVHRRERTGPLLAFVVEANLGAAALFKACV